jgi:hypothetical protein
LQPPFYLSDNVMSLPGYVIEDKTFTQCATFYKVTRPLKSSGGRPSWRLINTQMV